MLVFLRNRPRHPNPTQRRNWTFPANQANSVALARRPEDAPAKVAARADWYKRGSRHAVPDYQSPRGYGQTYENLKNAAGGQTGGAAKMSPL